jgi:hypothetical protein
MYNMNGVDSFLFMIANHYFSKVKIYLLIRNKDGFYRF